MPVLLALALTVSAPSTEAQRLGRKLAEHGTLASLLPLMKAKETGELLKEDATLTLAEQTKLRATADQVFQADFARLMKATGDAYAQQLSVEDMRNITQFYETPAAAHYLAASPNVIMATMKSVGGLDFKGEVRTAFCAEVKRLCSK